MTEIRKDIFESDDHIRFTIGDLLFWVGCAVLGALLALAWLG